jgi:transposase
MRSIGLDVGKHVAEIAISEPGRRTRSGGRISAAPESLRAFAATLGPDDQVVIEATTTTWAIVELLERHAGRVVVSNPLRTRAIADAKVKTDTIDAATLAELLAADYLPTVWQPDPETRALRRRVAGRAALVAERTRLRNRISAVLIRNLVASPWSDPFGTSGRAWLTAVELPADERELVDPTLRLVRWPGR